MIDEVINTSLQREAQFQAVVFTGESHLSDEHLVEAAISGDELAFAEIFERYKRQVTRTVSRFFRDRGEIEEFVQLAFTKSYFSLKKFRGGGDRSFAAWMTRIAINVCYDEFRRRQRKAESLFTEMSKEENDYLETLLDARQPTAETSLIAAELAAKVMAGLEAGDQIAMKMVYSEDYSLAEAADAIGITASSLKSRLFRCRNHIRKRFSHLI